MHADIPEIKRREHDTNSGNKKANLYYWNTDTLSWSKLSGTSSGINVVGGGGTLQSAYNAGNTITTSGAKGSVIIDNSTGGQELLIKGGTGQQVLEIYDSVADVSRIYGYTDGSIDIFPGGSANYGVYIAPQNESAAHLRLEPLTAPPSSLSEGDIFLEGDAVDRLKVYVNATTNTVAWLSDVATKQDTLVSATNIKTVNSTSLLGSGDLSITPNATHTGDVTGATTLTIDPTAITGKTAVTAVGTDYVLISDTSDSGNLKKALVSDFGGGGSGDMVLASAQTVTGAKTFNDTKLLMRNVADTYNGSFTNTNTANRVYTLQDKAGVVGLVVPRIISATSYTTSTTIDASITDVYAITAQAGALLFNNPTGSPQDGQGLVIRIKDNGTARALTYGSEFRGVVGALPSTTVLSKILYMAFMYNSAETKWDLIGKSQEA